MKIKGDWNNNFTKDQIEWKANSEKEIKKMMDKMNKKNDSLQQKMNEIDFNNRYPW